jgi:peptide/nickel transport system substrate-binding protein
MKFTDGEPVDAAAVVANIEALRKGSSTSQNWANVTGAEATDQLTVVVTLSRPDAALLPLLTGTVGAIGAPEALTAESSKLTPVGSGPYVLNTDETVTGTKYVLERNPDYWNAEAYPFDRVEMTIIADATAAQNALRAGEVDVLASAGAQEVVAQFPESDFDSGQSEPIAIGVIWFADHTGAMLPALGDVRVRKAINLAFDRETIATKLIGPGAGPTNQLFNPTTGVFDEALLKETPYDVKQARKLMAEAGYGDGFAVTMPSTVVSTQVESVITQSLADIGITVTWESVPFQDFYAKVFGGSYATFFMFNGLGAFPAADLQGSLSGVFNPQAQTTPELDALRLAADSAPESEQADAFGAVNEYLVEDSWAVPLFYSRTNWVASKKVKYTSPTQYGTNLLPFAPAGS